MASATRMFRVLLAARGRMLANTVRSATRAHKLIIGTLVLFGIAIFTAIGIACAALVLIMQGDSAPGSPLTPAATALVGHIYQYLFFFLLAGSVPYVASSLFQDNDLPLLLTTPAPPGSVVAAKMLDAIAANSSQFIVLGVPVLIGLGWGMGLSAAGWCWCLLSLALVLILTPSLTACLLLILAHLFGMRRVRFVVMLVSVLLALCITLLAVAGASRATAGGTLGFRQMGQVLMTHGAGRSTEIKTALTHSLHGAEPTRGRLTLRTAGTVWLPSTWAATVALDTADQRAIGGTGLAAAALLFGASAILLMLTIAIGSNVISSETILEQQDMESFGRKRGQGSALAGLRGVWLSVAGLLVKDLRYVGRDTILLGQIGTTLILFLVPFVLKGIQPNDPSSFDMYGDLAMLMICLIVFMVTSIIGLSSVGLEGRGVWIVLSSPMARRAFFLAKWTISFLLSIGIVVVLTTIAAVAFRWPWTTTRLLVGVLICACYALSGLGVGLGGLFPRFLYDNPAHRASVWAMILGFVLSTAYVVVTLGVFFVVWAAYTQQFAEAPLVAAAAAGVFMFLTLLTGMLPIRLAERQLEQYEWEL